MNKKHIHLAVVGALCYVPPLYASELSFIEAVRLNAPTYSKAETPAISIAEVQHQIIQVSLNNETYTSIPYINELSATTDKVNSPVQAESFTVKEEELKGEVIVDKTLDRDQPEEAVVVDKNPIVEKKSKPSFKKTPLPNNQVIQKNNEPIKRDSMVATNSNLKTSSVDFDDSYAPDEREAETPVMAESMNKAPNQNWLANYESTKLSEHYDFVGKQQVELPIFIARHYFPKSQNLHKIRSHIESGGRVAVQGLSGCYHEKNRVKWANKRAREMARMLVNNGVRLASINIVQVRSYADIKHRPGVSIVLV